MPIIDVVPDMDDPPRGFWLVLREIDRFLAVRSLPVERSFDHEPAGEVKEVVRLLSGRSVNIVENLESEETLDLLATRCAESKLPSLEELQRFADANPPAESWYDEDL